MDKFVGLFFGFCMAAFMAHGVSASGGVEHAGFLSPSALVLVLIVASFCAIVFKHASGNKVRMDIERVRRAVRK
ncbi:MAG: hypothetical protein DRN71_02430 [Candidatus Nanohalarchaeota archaeon]|nr:MAG: hypothetical protein DRN71_02430 [Candidatus Nanohaloarchaeota archaeon]